MDRQIVISLCDLTGNFTTPWSEAGYDVVLVDPQHGFPSASVTESGATITKIAGTIDDALPELMPLILSKQVAFVAGFPPCTDLSVSGARWFASKYAADPYFQARAARVAEQCHVIGQLSGAPFFVENPVSVLATIWRKPDHYFHPWMYSALAPDDNYTKRTNLWTGGGFIMPPAAQDSSLGQPDNRIHMAPPGPERANFRSATPMGFARAVFAANSRG